MALVLILNIIFNLLIIFFILRMSIDEREFFFSPVLQPVYRVTEPVLRLIQSHVAFFDHHRNSSSALIIAGLIVLRGLLFTILTTRILLYSSFSFTLAFYLPPDLKMGISLSCLNFLDILFQVFTVLLISYLLVPAYSTNPIIRFTASVLDPFLKMTSRLLSFLKRGIPILTIILLILCHFLITILCFYLCSFDIVKSLEPLLTHSVSSQYPLDESPQPTFLSARSAYPQIFYSTLNLFFRALGFFTIVIIIGAVMSWFRPDPFNPLVQWIETVNMPILAPLRKYIPLLGDIDLSPVLAIIIIEFGRQALDTLSLHLLNLYH
ncbi:YggT family protein [bacterium]|nr:YggT family protein [bacterium]